MKLLLGKSFTEYPWFRMMITNDNQGEILSVKSLEKGTDEKVVVDYQTDRLFSERIKKGTTRTLYQKSIDSLVSFRGSYVIPGVVYDITEEEFNLFSQGAEATEVKAETALQKKLRQAEEELALYKAKFGSAL